MHAITVNLKSELRLIIRMFRISELFLVIKILYASEFEHGIKNLVNERVLERE